VAGGTVGIGPVSSRWTSAGEGEDVCWHVRTAAALERGVAKEIARVLAGAGLGGSGSITTWPTPRRRKGAWWRGEGAFARVVRRCVYKRAGRCREQGNSECQPGRPSVPYSTHVVARRMPAASRLFTRCDGRTRARWVYGQLTGGAVLPRTMGPYSWSRPALRRWRPVAVDRVGGEGGAGGGGGGGGGGAGRHRAAVRGSLTGGDRSTSGGASAA